MTRNAATAIRQHRLWRSQAAVRAYALARLLANRCGLQVVLKTYYSPIPDLDAVPQDTWEQVDPMRGIHFDLGSQLEFMERELAPLLRQFGSDAAVEARYAYEPENPSYPLADARLLFAMIRWLRPRTVVELGSGQTSRVIAHACRLNAVEGQQCRFRVFDPFPTTIDAGLPGLTELVLTDAQSTPETIFSGLATGDVLVVDTTHTVKLGSEVNRLVLRLLPMLAPGVHVHFHDIWLPYEYPRDFFDRYGLYWTEQYLLQAFLCLNPSFEVVCATHALTRDLPDETAALGLSAGGGIGASFWIRRSVESAHR